MNVIFILCDTLRRDHCSPYHQNRTLREFTGDGQPDWVVPTPNLERLARRGTVFDHCWCGSSPCMPARRDIYTGRYEFPFRGWGPLEDDDLDLPRQISGPPNISLSKPGQKVSYLVSDHFHLWEKGSGNYHMGFSGFDFIRGMESDAYHTDPISFPLPSESYRTHKAERHYRNVELIRKRSDGTLDEEQWFASQTFSKAADWLKKNHARENFFLHIDSFPPHEPWDPPERFVKMFDSRGYDIPEYFPTAPYQSISKSGFTPDQVRHIQALYAASVVHVDHCLGRLLKTMDDYDLWKNTMIIFTTDHGTYNGDRGLLGKLQTHQFDPVSHIPLIISHPEWGQGERRDQLAQLVDIYPTVLSALRIKPPKGIHGIDLLPVLENSRAKTRSYALAGIFGKSVTITDGRWILHQQPPAKNTPLYWYSHRLPMFIPFDVGPYTPQNRRIVRDKPFPGETWLSDKQSDPNELVNLAKSKPRELLRMQKALKGVFKKIGAPPEQLKRLGIQAI